MVARRDWTRQWWDHYASDYELVTSESVLFELQQGNYEMQAAVLDMMTNMRQLDAVEAVDDIVDAYQANHLMPKQHLGDAHHLAMASYHKCDFLLTWNCSHIANANKFEHIRVINTRLGLFVPMLVTPLQFIEDNPS